MLLDHAKTNKNIKNRWGADYRGRPWFRLSWAPDQWEMRHGTFHEFSPGGDIFLRTVTETRSCPKYPYIGDRWIIEILIDYTHPDLPENKDGSYECLYVFADKDDNYLEPSWKVIEIVIENWFSRKSIAENMQRNQEIDEIKKKDQYIKDRDILETGV